MKIDFFIDTDVHINRINRGDPIFTIFVLPYYRQILIRKFIICYLFRMGTNILGCTLKPNKNGVFIQKNKSVCYGIHYRIIKQILRIVECVCVCVKKCFVGLLTYAVQWQYLGHIPLNQWQDKPMASYSHDLSFCCRNNRRKTLNIWWHPEMEKKLRFKNKNKQ